MTATDDTPPSLAGSARPSSAEPVADSTPKRPERLPATVISLCENGPLLVRGDFVLEHIADGRSIEARRNVIALCRCGLSQLAPFCDGSHTYQRRPSV